jgi:hypothetical protein
VSHQAITHHEKPPDRSWRPAWLPTSLLHPFHLSAPLLIVPVGELSRGCSARSDALSGSITLSNGGGDKRKKNPEITCPWRPTGVDGCSSLVPRPSIYIHRRLRSVTPWIRGYSHQVLNSIHSSAERTLFLKESSRLVLWCILVLAQSESDHHIVLTFFFLLRCCCVGIFYARWRFIFYFYFKKKTNPSVSDSTPPSACLSLSRLDLDWTGT